MTSGIAEQRNDFLLALAARVLIAYAAPGSRTDLIGRKALAMGKELRYLDEERGLP